MRSNGLSTAFGSLAFLRLSGLRHISFTKPVLASVLGALCLAGCAQVNTKTSRIDPKYGVAASPKVVADGEPVPHGGGTRMVGKPYVVAGETYYPSEKKNYSAVGTASWYGDAFHGRKTANGEVFDKDSISAAHPTMPLPSYARVTNLRNHRSIIVRVNDRGPYHGGRVMDVSQRVAEALDFKRAGTGRIKIDYVGDASLKGSDDRRLLATLRTDGQPAVLNGTAAYTQPTQVASAEPEAPQTVARRETGKTQSEDVSAIASTPVREVSYALKPSNAPVPVSRPFDLGTIPGAATPISAPPVVTGMLARQKQAMAASYYAEPEAAPSHFRARSPFDSLKAQNFQSLQTRPDF